MAQESAELDVRAVVVLGCGGGGGFHAVGMGVECHGGRYPWAGGGGGSMRLGWELKRAMNLEWAVSSAAIAAWAVRALGFSA